MTTPACPVCAHQPVQYKFSFRDYPIHHCPACGARFIYPQPTDAVLEQIYNADYFLSDGTPAGIERMQKMKQATAAMHLEKLLAKTSQKRGKLLEVGCGTGSFLVEAVKKGFEVCGLEISPHAAYTANQRLGFSAVTAGTLETQPQPAETYDVIALSDVYEHLREPRWFVQEAYRILKPGGRIFIVTCSLDSLSSRLSGRYWLEYKVEHLVYSTVRSMRLALSQPGFSDIEIRPDEKILTIDYIDQHFQRFTVPLLTPLIHTGRTILGERLSNHPLRLTTSGMIATAFKAA